MDISIEKGKSSKPIEVGLEELSDTEELRQFVDHFSKAKYVHDRFKGVLIDYFLKLGYLAYISVIILLLLLAVNSLGFNMFTDATWIIVCLAVASIVLLATIFLPSILSRLNLRKSLLEVNKTSNLYSDYFTKEHLTYVDYRAGYSRSESIHPQIRTLMLLSKIVEDAVFYVSDVNLNVDYLNVDGYELIKDVAIKYKDKYYILGCYPKHTVDIDKYEFIEITQLFDNKRYTIKGTGL